MLNHSEMNLNQARVFDTFDIHYRADDIYIGQP